MTISNIIPASETLGNLNLYEILFRRVFSSAVGLTESDIRTYCSANYYRAGKQLDVMLPLLVKIGALERTEEVYKPGRQFRAITASERLTQSLAERIVSALVEADELGDVFGPGCISLGKDCDDLYIHFSRVPFRYHALIKFLSECGAFEEGVMGSPAAKIVSPFSDFLRRFLQTTHPRSNRKMTPKQLEAMLEAQRRQGDVAEKAVLDFEVRRLASHPGRDGIRRISLENVSAGYDIISFENAQSVVPDRFIEVKSFSTELVIHWSSREVSVAQEMQDFYFLYIVDVSRMGMPLYEPTMIRNPYKVLLSDKGPFRVAVDGYSVEFLSSDWNASQ